MSKQRKKKKVAAVSDGRKKSNIVPNYHRITYSSSDDSIDVLNNDNHAESRHSSEDKDMESDTNDNLNMDVTEVGGNSNEGEEISDQNNDMEESNLNLTFQEK